MIALMGGLGDNEFCTSLMYDWAAVEPCVGGVLEVNTTTIRNGNFDEFYVTSNGEKTYTIEKPESWDNDTVINATFTDGVGAGNIDFDNQDITSIIVQRQRVYRDIDTHWQTIYRYDVAWGETTNPDNPLDFTYRDYFVAYGETYHYRLIPVTQQGETEVEYNIGVATSPLITSIFDGVFICDNTTSYRLFGQVEFDSLQNNQESGIHATLGNKYPIVVMNSAANYHTGGISAMVLPDDFGKIVPQVERLYNIVCVGNDNCWTTGAIEQGTQSIMERVGLDRQAIIQQRQEIEEFLSNKKPKVLKDWNGNIWLVMFTEGQTITFDNNWGMGVNTIEATWTEIGNPYNEEDMEYAGLVEGV